MPFGSFTKVTRADSDAIFAYLQSVPPANTPNRPDDLRFPFNNRSLILGWRTLYFNEGEYKPDASKSDEWNRGAYLVQGLGHCAMCHTAINALGGSSESEAFQGGLIPLQNWYAPSLTSNKEAGLGDWSFGDIADLLRTGVSARGAVYGPMAEVVYNSLQYLNDADIRAMAVYLKGLAAGSPPASASSRIPSDESSLLMSLGKSVYDSTLRELSRTRRRRQASELSSARRQSVHPDVLRGQRNPDGADRRISSGNRAQSDADRNAAVRADAVRQRSRGGGQLHPHVLGQSRRRGDRRRGERIAFRSGGLRAS